PPFPKTFAQPSLRPARSVQLDRNPRGATGAGDVYVTHAHGSEARRDLLRNAAPGLLGHHRDRQLRRQATEGVEDPAEVAIAFRLDDLLRRVQVKADGIGADGRSE